PDCNGMSVVARRLGPGVPLVRREPLIRGFGSIVLRFGHPLPRRKSGLVARRVGVPGAGDTLHDFPHIEGNHGPVVAIQQESRFDGTGWFGTATQDVAGIANGHEVGIGSADAEPVSRRSEAFHTGRSAWLAAR